jgi:hypothetical protein
VPATSLFAITSDGRGTPENSSYMLFATICLGISIDGFTGLDYQRRAYLPIALSGKSREHHVIFLIGSSSALLPPVESWSGD